MCIYVFFWLILAKNIGTNKHPLLKALLSALGAYLLQYLWQRSTKNIKTNKRPPVKTLLSALGAYWNEYGK